MCCKVGGPLQLTAPLWCKMRACSFPGIPHPDFVPPTHTTPPPLPTTTNPTPPPCENSDQVGGLRGGGKHPADAVTVQLQWHPGPTRVVITRLRRVRGEYNTNTCACTRLSSLSINFNLVVGRWILISSTPSWLDTKLVTPE